MSDVATAVTSVGESVGTATVEHEGFTVTSNETTPEAMKESLATTKVSKEKAAKAEGEEEKPSKAAESGKKGGEATAALKRKEAREARRAEREAQKSEEAAPDAQRATGEADEASDDDTEKLGKPRDDPKARMLEATRQAAQLKREIAEIRAENERIRRDVAEARQAKPADKPAIQEDPDPEPKSEDFSEWETWLKEHNKWSARQASHEEITKAEQARYQRESAARWGQSIKQHVEQYVSRLGETPEEVNEFVAELHPDVQALKPTFLMDGNESPGPLNVVADEITSSENARPLLLLFSDFPQELQRLATLRTPHEVVREMARLEARLEAALAGNSAPTRETSQAPNPPRPVRGAPPIAEGGKYRPGMSIDDYARGWKPAQQR